MNGVSDDVDELQRSRQSDARPGARQSIAALGGMRLVLERFVEERNGCRIDPDGLSPWSTALKLHMTSAAGFLLELCPNLVHVFLHDERQFLLEEHDRCWHDQPGTFLDGNWTPSST